MDKYLERYIVLEKMVGETPLQRMEQYRAMRAELADMKLAYAGRLDPMASGKLLVLIGEECKNQEAYFGLDKEYEFEVLLGISSDSGDVLGVVEADENEPVTISKKNIRKVIGKYKGDISLPYPRFSSKTVGGKPLHTWTLEGRLNEIEIPMNTTRVYSLKNTGRYTITKDELREYAFEKIDSLPKVTEKSKELGHDFRRAEVKASWNTLFENNLRAEYTVLSFRCISSSGTYMRSLAECIGSELGTRGLALSIHRTKIGKYQPLDPLSFFRFWKKKY